MQGLTPVCLLTGSTSTSSMGASGTLASSGAMQSAQIWCTGSTFRRLSCPHPAAWMQTGASLVRARPHKTSSPAVHVSAAFQLFCPSNSLTSLTAATVVLMMIYWQKFIACVGVTMNKYLIALINIGISGARMCAGCCIADSDGTPTIMYTGVRLRSNPDCGPLPPQECDLNLPFIESQLIAVPESGAQTASLWASSCRLWSVICCASHEQAHSYAA